jgi:hypothetical protein
MSDEGRAPQDSPLHKCAYGGKTYAIPDLAPIELAEIWENMLDLTEALRFEKVGELGHKFYTLKKTDILKMLDVVFVGLHAAVPTMERPEFDKIRALPIEILNGFFAVRRASNLFEATAFEEVAKPGEAKPAPTPAPLPDQSDQTSKP